MHLILVSYNTYKKLWVVIVLPFLVIWKNTYYFYIEENIGVETAAGYVYNVSYDYAVLLEFIPFHLIFCIRQRFYRFLTLNTSSLLFSLTYAIPLQGKGLPKFPQ